MATAGASRSNLLDLVHCDLCLEIYNDSDRLPKLLPCSHTFCLDCVEKYYKTNLKTNLTCPNCREVFTVPRGGVQKLKTNIMVVNLLDHLAQSPVDKVDTDDSTQTPSGVPEAMANEESKSTACNVHPGEKCDFYCHDCDDPMCADCMVSLSEGPHKTHTISKWKDVLITYNTQRKDALQLVAKMKIEGQQRTEELLKELKLSRDSLIKAAKFKCDIAHQEADRWYQNIIGNISQIYDKLHDQIAKFTSKVNLQELQHYLENMKLQKIDGDLKVYHNILNQLHSFVDNYKETTLWWSVDIGKLDDKLIIDIGKVTEPTIRLSDVTEFPYTIEQTLCSTNTNQSMNKNQPPAQLGFKTSSYCVINPPCHWIVGLTTNEAIGCSKAEHQVKKIAFSEDQFAVVDECALPWDLNYQCVKFFLKNKYILLRKKDIGPSYLLNEQLEVVNIIEEKYGIIIGAHSIHWVAFGKDSVIQIYDVEEQQVLKTLVPPAGIYWSGLSSICRHPDSDLTAVVDYSSTMCIYDHESGRVGTSKLEFLPLSSYAISCNRRHIYILSQHPVSVFVFTWSGQLVTILDEQQLGIAEGERIWNIAVDENQFTIAVGGSNEVYKFGIFPCV